MEMVNGDMQSLIDLQQVKTRHPLAHPPHPSPPTSHRVASSLAEAYELVYATLGDPSSGYPEAGGTAGIKHTPAQVRTILGVAG